MTYELGGLAPNILGPGREQISQIQNVLDGIRPNFKTGLDQAQKISDLLDPARAPELGGLAGILDGIGGEATRIQDQLGGIMPPDKFTQKQLLDLFPDIGVENLGLPSIGIDQLGLPSIGVDQLDLPNQDQILQGMGLTDQAGKYNPGGGGVDNSGQLDEIMAAIQGLNTGSAAPTQTDSGGFINQLEEVLFPLVNSDPFNIDQLRNDPVTAAMLMDLTKETEQREEDRIEQLQRMGVIRSGSNVETGVDLDEASLRAEFDILSRGAERARADRDTGLSRGIDLAGLESDRELGFGEALGSIGGEKTLGGRQADLDVIASILAALDPDLATSEGVDKTQLAEAILRTSGFNDANMGSFMAALGLDFEGRGGGDGLKTPPGY